MLNWYESLTPAQQLAVEASGFAIAMGICVVCIAIGIIWDVAHDTHFVIPKAKHK